MHQHLDGFVAESTECGALGCGGIGEHSQRLVRLCSHHHVIESPRRLALNRNDHAIRLSPQRRDLRAATQFGHTPQQTRSHVVGTLTGAAHALARETGTEVAHDHLGGKHAR